MKLLASATLSFLLATSLIGCDSSQVSDGKLHPKSEAAVQLEVPPRHQVVQILINTRPSTDYEFDGKNGCSTDYTPKQPVSNIRIDQALTCGYPGAVSKLSWKYTHTDNDGDHYHFTRIFPLDEANQSTTESNVVFNGEEVTVFQDDAQRIVLRLKSGEDAKPDGA